METRKRYLWGVVAALWLVLPLATAEAADCNCSAPDSSCSASISCPASCWCVCLSNGRCCCDCDFCLPDGFENSVVGVDFKEVPAQQVLAWVESQAGPRAQELEVDRSALYGKRVTIKFERATLGHILQELSRAAGVPIRGARAVPVSADEPLSMCVKGIELGRLLDFLGQQFNVSFKADDPRAKIDLKAENVTLRELVQQLRDLTGQNIVVERP